MSVLRHQLNFCEHTLHSEAVGCTLPVVRKMKTEIPAKVGIYQECNRAVLLSLQMPFSDLGSRSS